MTIHFPSKIASTPPVALCYIYEEMGWHRRTLFGMASTIRNSSSSAGRIITTHSRDGARRYPIHSQVQTCDLPYRLPHMLVAWPVIDGDDVDVDGMLTDVLVRLHGWSSVGAFWICSFVL